MTAVTNETAVAGPQPPGAFYIQEPPFPHSITWPPFVPRCSIQIDNVLVCVPSSCVTTLLRRCPQYMVMLDPRAPRDADYLKDLSEYMLLEKQLHATEKELLNEHQLMLNPRSIFVVSH